jgi:hypothetical protein
MPSTRSIQIWSALFFVFSFPLHEALAQTIDPHAGELESRVGVLSDFHGVIYQIWHTAWPEKNVGMLVDLLPQVKQYSDTLSRVKLDGILRDKQDLWDEGTARLRSIVAAYGAAAAPVDSAKLLDAAERLHSQYEALVRVVRPVTKELDEFHQVLYMIYHHYWPEKDLKKLPAAVDSLKVKMAALNTSALPSRLKQREGAFNAARVDLSGTVDILTAADAASSPEKFAADLEKLHDKYQSLERVFE